MSSPSVRSRRPPAPRGRSIPRCRRWRRSSSRAWATPPIDSARSYILGQYALGFETAADWAGALADLDLYHLPESYIDDYRPQLLRVDAAASKQVVAAAYPRAEDVDIVLIGDAGRIRADVAKLGPVLEKPLGSQDFERRQEFREPPAIIGPGEERSA